MICIKSAVSSLSDEIVMTSWWRHQVFHIIVQAFDFGFSVGVGGVGVDFWLVAADFWPESPDT